MNDAPTFEGRLYTDGDLQGVSGRWVRRAEYDVAFVQNGVIRVIPAPSAKSDKGIS